MRKPAINAPRRRGAAAGIGHDGGDSTVNNDRSHRIRCGKFDFCTTSVRCTWSKSPRLLGSGTLTKETSYFAKATSLSTCTWLLTATFRSRFVLPGLDASRSSHLVRASSWLVVGAGTIVLHREGPRTGGNAIGGNQRRSTADDVQPGSAIRLRADAPDRIGVGQTTQSRRGCSSKCVRRPIARRSVRKSRQGDG